MRYRGTKGDDTLIGTDAGDIFAPKLGHDTVDGGGGYDYLNVDYSANISSGAPGIIRIDADGTMSGTLTGGIANDVAFANIEELDFIGAQGDDRLIVEVATGLGANRFLTLDGGEGVDTLEFHSKSLDTVQFDIGPGGVVDSTEMVVFDFERFELYLGAGDDYIDTGDRDDILSGGGGHDHLYGGGGDDLLIGGRGSDSMIGGSGADTYRYTRLGELISGRDSIVNFEGANGDRIDLSRVDADASAAGRQHFTFVGQAVFTGAGGDAYEVRIAEQRGTYAVLEGDVNHDGAADFAFSISSEQPLVATDFIL